MLFAVAVLTRIARALQSDRVRRLWSALPLRFVGGHERWRLGDVAGLRGLQAADLTNHMDGIGKRGKSFSWRDRFVINFP